MKEKVRVYTLNAFAEQSGGGNPAGVVLDAEQLSDERMLRIAKEVGFSETAFVSGSSVADFRVRFFTPVEEVDFCGHATVGTFFLLNHLGILAPGVYKQETKAGILGVRIDEDGLVTMQQSNAAFYERITKREEDFEKVCRSLSIGLEDIGAQPTLNGEKRNLYINHMEIVSTGLRDLMIPVRSVEILNRIVPSNELIEEISRKYRITGYHVFAMGTEYTASTRNFAPLVGIDEESATGSSNGALGSFLIKSKIINEEKKNIAMVFEQGISMNRPSKIYVNILKEAPWSNRVEEVYVGGRAADVCEMEVEL